MNRSELAALLADANDDDRRALLVRNQPLADVELAFALKDSCLEGFSNNPHQAIASAQALETLFDLNPNPEIAALSHWGAGLRALVQGNMHEAIDHLEQSHQGFIGLGKAHAAASTEVSKLIALAMLGRYDEAIECGMRAREVFLAHNDMLAAGKIENNIGNLWFRRDRYFEAEQFQSAAKQRFQALNDTKQLAIINNCLANTAALLHHFKLADELYEEALEQAEASGQIVRLAEIEGNIGVFALLQGRYAKALDYLEKSRRRYASLEMPHQSAIAEQEIADAYLELNLIPEATKIYERVTRTFSELGMRAEEARALAYHARAAIAAGQAGKAHGLLTTAAQLYGEEGNRAGAAWVRVTEASLFHAQGRCHEARQAATLAEPELALAGAPRRLMFARWLRGDAARGEGAHDEAREILNATLREAEADQPDVAARCLTSLGLLSVDANDTTAAEQTFKQAVALIEELRAPLPAEEFRTSFFADKLLPYQQLTAICLDNNRNAEALQYVEQARSRALADIAAGDGTLLEARDDFEKNLGENIETIREELNYFYRRLNAPRERVVDGARRKELENEMRAREQQIGALTRQLQHRARETGRLEVVDLDRLQQQLGNDTTLIEYAAIGEELVAFLVSADEIEVRRNLGRPSDIETEIAQFRFQIDALRFGSASIRKHMASLTERARRHLRSLHSSLFAPLAEKVVTKRLVIVPHRALHYLPFEALDDGAGYLIERYEISYAPSALLLQQCLDRSHDESNRILLLGLTDESIPHVEQEIKAIEDIFPDTLTLIGNDATIASLRERAPDADVIHLACHGQFRSDNPLFSSLQLADGWFTVRDAYKLKLKCNLVTLSACETGMNEIAPGDELIGMARGFFAAGAPAVLLSLWTVDDEATGELMREFYAQLRQSGSATAALRMAQIKLLKEKPHPFFWSPFVLTGRW